MERAVAYLRVSTQRQHRKIIAEFIEAEFGKGADALDRRPKLAQPLRQPSRPSARSWFPSWIAYLAMSPSSRA
jgi:hypothetical protein